MTLALYFQGKILKLPYFRNIWPHCKNIKECEFFGWVDILFKGLITVGRELRHKHPSDLLSGAGTSRERSSRDVPAGPWSIPIITWLNNVVWNVFTTKYVQNLHQNERRRLLASIVTSRISLTTGVLALHIPSWRIEMREERRKARKIVCSVNAGRVICRYQNNLCGIINHHKHKRRCFLDV